MSILMLAIIHFYALWPFNGAEVKVYGECLIATE